MEEVMQQTTLNTAELGRTGLRITRVGFGAWAIGGGGWAHGWGEQDDEASVAAIRHAVESGLLTGAFTAQRAGALPADDWRSRDAEFTGDRLHRNLALVDALRPVADRHNSTVASVAIAWCLAQPGVTAAIVGARGPGQVDGWIGAPDIELDTTDLTDIADAIHRTGAGHGGR
jgi:aryl-alcohol dehydrogenase-like predicted oxidoreductase